MKEDQRRETREETGRKREKRDTRWAASVRDKQDRGQRASKRRRGTKITRTTETDTEEETVMRVLSRNNQWDTRIPTYLIDYHVRARSKFHIVPVVVHPLQKYERGASCHRSSETTHCGESRLMEGNGTAVFCQYNNLSPLDGVVLTIAGVLRTWGANLYEGAAEGSRRYHGIIRGMRRVGGEGRISRKLARSTESVHVYTLCR